MQALQETVQGTAQQKFATMQWPGAADEEWRRTRIADLPLDDLVPGLLASASGGGAFAVSEFIREPEGRYGEPGEILADTAKIAALVTLHSAAAPSIWMHETVRKSGVQITVGPVVNQRLRELGAKVLAAADNRFILWNLAQMQACVWVHVPSGVVLETPIVLDWQFEGDDKAFFPLLVIDVADHAVASVASRVAGTGFVNYLTMAVLADNAKLESTLVQELDESAVFVSHDEFFVGRDASLKHYAASFGSGMCKTRATARLEGSGAEAFLDGIYFARHEQHMDMRTVQFHDAPHTTSRALYKGVARDSGRSIYQGMIHVAPQAVKTDAYLTNKNMVLNDGARADSIPSLNIQTNDVKCSHGSTTGKLPEEQVFYLQTRGFSRKEAEVALIGAYLDEIVDQLPEILRTHVRYELACKVAEGCLDFD